MKERKEMKEEGRKIWKKSSREYQRQIQEGSVDSGVAIGV